MLQEGVTCIIVPLKKTCIFLVGSWMSLLLSWGWSFLTLGVF